MKLFGILVFALSLIVMCSADAGARGGRWRSRGYGGGSSCAPATEATPGAACADGSCAALQAYGGGYASRGYGGPVRRVFGRVRPVRRVLGVVARPFRRICGRGGC